MRKHATLAAALTSQRFMLFVRISPTQCKMVRRSPFFHQILVALDYATALNGVCPQKIASNLDAFGRSLSGAHLQRLIEKQVALKFPHQKSLDMGNIFLVARTYLFFYEVVCAVISKDRDKVSKAVVPRYQREMKEYRESILMTYAFDGYLVNEEFKPSRSITGDLKDLPKFVVSVKSIDLSANEKITGDIKDFPKSVINVDLSSNPIITGTLKDLPKAVEQVKLYFNHMIAGDIRDLPDSVRKISFAHNAKITGFLKDLPKTVTELDLECCLRIAGDLRHLPKGLKKINLAHNWMIRGDLKDLPQSVTDIDLSYNTIITGDLSEMPKSVVNINLAGNKLITDVVKAGALDATYLPLKDRRWAN